MRAPRFRLPLSPTPVVGTLLALLLGACGTAATPDGEDVGRTGRDTGDQGDAGVDAADVATDTPGVDTTPDGGGQPDADAGDDTASDATDGSGDTIDDADVIDDADASDDADTVDDTDTAPDVVVPPNCGDGVLDDDEECDDANDDDTDTCTSWCTIATCGDGVVGLQRGEVSELAPVVTSPYDVTGPVCDTGATCPGSSCEVGDDGTAPEHGICQALGYARAVRVTWGGSEGADADPAPRAWNWGCFDYDCTVGPRSDSAGACGAGRMLVSIVCDGWIEEPCDDGANGTGPNQCRPGCELPTCGDGVTDDAYGEDCDDANDVPNDGCNLCLYPQCGDGLVQAGEQCDDGNDDDTDACRSDCTLPVCGDGIVQPGEECDDGPDNSERPDACRPNCRLAACGDLVIDSAEDCDDGNTIPDDGCSANCLTPQCGDGIVQAGAPFNEQCDDGNRVDDDGCSNLCQFAFCGDGIVQFEAASIDELWDFEDGTVPAALSMTEGDWTVVSDSPEGSFSLRSRDIGDSQSVRFSLDVSLRAETEVSFWVKAETESCCDDLNFYVDGTANGRWAGNVDWTFVSVTVPAGDHLLEWTYEKDISISTGADAGWVDDIRLFGAPSVSELCDDGPDNADAPDSCRTDCQLPTCGDGIVDSDETCDDGNLVDGDACSSTCLPPVCGDGVRQGGEECDDGNLIETDTCRNDCRAASCGDGIIQSGERVVATRYSFEDGALPATFRTTPGDWTVVDGGGDGSFSLRSRDIGDSQSVRVETDVVFADDTEVTFWVRVESESCCDDLNFYVDGTANGRWAGMVDWTEVSVVVPAGAHTLAWTYEKDSSASTGADAGWIDGIAFDQVTIVDEVCDDGVDNSDTAPDACRTTCELPRCGDGAVDTGELCDDGNDIDGDACSTLCEPPICGDGIRQGDEECDDANDDETDACLSSCVLASCGDGIVQRDTTPPETLYDFEGGSIPPAFVLTPGDWTIVGDAASGSGAIRSRDINDNQTVRIATNVSFAVETVVSFWLKVESESCCDDLNFFVDGAPQGRWAGVLDWQRVEFTVPAGDHELAWTYEKDISLSTGGDAGWLDDIRFAAAETVTEQCDDGVDNSDTLADACRLNCQLPRCGDGATDTGEECDDGNDIDDDTCANACTLPICGDGIRQGDEECDLGDGNDNDTPDGCRTDCRAAYCTDGVVDTGEECDDGNDVNLDGCSNLCRAPRCGDGAVDLTGEYGDPEECDDGNDVDDDGCSNDCLLPVCGDNIVEGDEECDDGNANDNDRCRNNCRRAVCGDGVIGTWRQNATFTDVTVTNPFGTTGPVCDDGGSCEGGSCDVGDNGNAPEHGICQALGGARAVRVVWGGGPGDTSAEMPHAYNWTCADYVCAASSNDYDADNCSVGEMLNEIVCRVDVTEECDDGPENADAPGTCRTDCTLPFCGDGIVDPGEECDDANDVDDDTCSTLCLAPVCGDGIVQGDERCDDGNGVNDDDCANDCSLPRCGNGVLDALEDCDDGNAVDDDLCSNDCRANGVPGTDLNIGSALGSALASGSTTDAGNDHQPPAECTSNSAPEVSVSWIAPFDGTFDIDLCGSDFDTYLVVREGALDGPVPPDARPGHTPAGLACDDDDDSGACGLDSRVLITASAGQAYVIFVEGLGAASGNYVLNINASE